MIVKRENPAIGGYAEFSKCDTYRYVLKRRLSQPLRWVKPWLFIMLNPSTADENVLDPTIRRCVNFAEKMGGTELIVVNLFALRSTNPKGLLSHKDPVGPLNDQKIEEMISYTEQRNGIIIAAWGAMPFARERASQMYEKYGSFRCFGVNKGGLSPKHPLYLRNDSTPHRWIG